MGLTLSDIANAYNSGGTAAVAAAQNVTVQGSASSSWTGPISPAVQALQTAQDNFIRNSVVQYPDIIVPNNITPTQGVQAINTLFSPAVSNRILTTDTVKEVYITQSDAANPELKKDSITIPTAPTPKTSNEINTQDANSGSSSFGAMLPILAIGAALLLMKK